MYGSTHPWVPPASAPGRMSALYEAEMLDTPPEECLDRLTRLAAGLLGTPAALVNLLDDEREFCKSAFCGAGPYAAGQSSPLERSFCLHAVVSRRPVVIPDARLDPRVSRHPAVIRGEIGSYLGIPLITRDGHAIGSLCVLDAVAREWTARDVALLSDLASSAASEIDLRRELLKRSRYEAALELERACLEQLFTSAPDGLVLLDPHDRVLRVNPEFTRMFGYSEEEVVGRTINSLIVPEEGQNDATDLTGRVAAGQRVAAEVTRRRKDGTPVSVSVLGAPIEVERGQVGVYGIYRDIGARKEIERLKEQIPAIVCHELRTPLTALRGSLGLLAGGLMTARPERGREMLDMAVRNTERLLRLVGDLLDMERLNAGHVSVEARWYPADELIAQALEVVRPAAEAAGVWLIAHSAKTRVYCDPDRIVQVLINLVANAVKFSPAGATVWLGVEEAGPEVVFSIRDQGRGIPAEKLSAIFEPFEQVEMMDSREKGGTGLGLAICRRIADLHRGRIWVDSAMGVGSTFFLGLPAPGDGRVERTGAACPAPVPASRA